MSSEFAIRAQELGKRFKVYARPTDRLKQLMLSSLSRRNYFSEFHAVQGVSLEVRRGESLGVIGANGSGKSTLLQLICGTMAPTTGRLEVRGRVVGLLELGSGFHRELSGRENVFVNAAIFGLTTAQVEERFERIAAFADIGEFIDRPIKTYSTGMSLRLAFAVAAHVDADMLVIDEALAVGDAVFAQKCMSFLREYAERGTLVLVSHDLEALKSLCRKVIWLDGGKIRKQGDAKEVCEQYFADVFGAAERDAPRRDDGDPEACGNSAISSGGSGEIAVVNGSRRSDAGTGGAELDRIDVSDDQGRLLSRISGGQIVRITVTARARARIDRPAMSFAVKDKLGQVLFAETTLNHPFHRLVCAKEGDILTAAFEFAMPRLPRGNYTIDGGVTECAGSRMVIVAWTRDAAALRCEDDRVLSGLIGVALSRVEFVSRSASSVPETA